MIDLICVFKRLLWQPALVEAEQRGEAGGRRPNVKGTSSEFKELK